MGQIAVTPNQSFLVKNMEFSRGGCDGRPAS